MQDQEKHFLTNDYSEYFLFAELFGNVGVSGRDRFFVLYSTLGRSIGIQSCNLVEFEHSKQRSGLQLVGAPRSSQVTMVSLVAIS